MKARGNDRTQTQRIASLSLPTERLFFFFSLSSSAPNQRNGLHFVLARAARAGTAARRKAQCSSIGALLGEVRFDLKSSTAAAFPISACPVAGRTPSLVSFALTRFYSIPLIPTLGHRPASRGPRPRSGRLDRSAGKEKSTGKKKGRRRRLVSPLDFFSLFAFAPLPDPDSTL